MQQPEGLGPGRRAVGPAPVGRIDHRVALAAILPAQIDHQRDEEQEEDEDGDLGDVDMLGHGSGRHGRSCAIGDVRGVTGDAPAR
jgi:hypothetical protein